MNPQTRVQGNIIVQAIDRLANSSGLCNNSNRQQIKAGDTSARSLDAAMDFAAPSVIRHVEAPLPKDDKLSPIRHLAAKGDG
jgi:hypothetical protein